MDGMTKRMRRIQALIIGCVLTAASLLGTAAPALAVHAGGNYTMVDSAYNFIDISTSGTLVPDVTTCDDCTEPLPLGFSFNYYGTEYTDVLVSSNGFLSFDLMSGSGCCEGQPLPTSGAPNNLIAGFWTDLDPGEFAAGNVYFQLTGSPGSQVFIVQFDEVETYNAWDVPQTFQFQLFENGDLIEVHYESVVGLGGTTENDISAGIENADGTVGVQYFFDDWENESDNVTLNNTAVCYNPGHGIPCTNAPPPPASPAAYMTLDPETATKEVGDPHTLTAFVFDSDGSPTSGAEVTFQVSGANTASSVVTADRLGKATFTYVGANVGSDTIVAFVDRDRNGAPDSDDPSASATATWVPAEEEPPPPPPKATCPGLETVPGNHVVGTEENNVLVGTDGPDVICGLGGDDSIDALGGDDLVFGGEGNDAIDGGDGNDDLDAGVGDDVVSGRGGDDTIAGRAGNDTLKGNAGNDTLAGSADNDTLQGGSGMDTLAGGAGADVLRGWTHDDTLRGGRGHDILNGHSGFDVCRGGRGNNVIRNCER